MKEDFDYNTLYTKKRYVTRMYCPHHFEMAPCSKCVAETKQQKIINSIKIESNNHIEY